jgi:Fe-S cluster assembly protein SufD
MTQVAPQVSRYLAAFEALEAASAAASPPWLHRIRREAITRFAEQGFPTVRLEDWKYTNVAPIVATAFHVADTVPAGLPAQAVERLVVGEPAAHRLVFVNGRYSAALSSAAPLPGGVRVASLAEALGTDAAVLDRHLGRHAAAEGTGHGFTALSTAIVHDGAFVQVPAGVRLTTPIYLLFVATAPAGPVLAQPRNLFVADPGSEATLVESYVGLGDQTYLTNAVTEVVLGEGAILQHYKVEHESERAYHVGTTAVVQGRDSSFTSGSIAVGGALARNNLGVLLAAPGASCALSGLYVLHGRQHVDNHTFIDHAAPRCTSRQLYKGVLDGSARAVFNGRVTVRRDAQHTDAHQTNKNLLLSKGAEVDTKPQLEIFADDVKCTHGAAVGQLGEDAVFYLRSRGLGEEAARTLLTYGFMSEVINRITVEPIRAQLDSLLMARLREARAVKETR